MQDHPRSAGAAAALLCALRYLFGGIAAPLVGLGGDDTAVPMGIVIAALAAAALACALASARMHRPPAAATPQ
ncbi:MAG: transporter, partial [Thermoleophilia bacterium]|nr:transporter [Thermoleophilia bacterium]